MPPTKKPKAKLSKQKLGVEALVKELSSKYKKKALITLGRDFRFAEIERVPTGSFGLDWAISGGWPRGRISQLKGPESASKTTLSLHAAALACVNKQRVLWASAEEFDWSWAVKCGVPEGSTNFGLALAEEGNHLLDLVIDATFSGQWDLIVIDSIAALRNWEYLIDGRSGKINKGVGEMTRGGEAKMINEFVARFFSACHGVTRRREDGEDVRLPALIAINQIRTQGLGSGYAKNDSGGGWGLKHGKSVDVFLRRAENIVLGEKDDPMVVARRVHFEITKNKTGVPYRHGTYCLGLLDHGGYTKGRIDRAGEVAQLAKRMGIIQQAGAWFAIEDTKFQGEAQLVAAIRDDDVLRQALEQKIVSLQ